MITDPSELIVGEYYDLWFYNDNPELSAPQIMRVKEKPKDSSGMINALVFKRCTGGVHDMYFGMTSGLVKVAGPISYQDEILPEIERADKRLNSFKQ